MADDCKEEMPFIRKKILINDLGNHVILIQGALHPSKESQNILIGRIIIKIFRRKVKGSV